MINLNYFLFLNFFIKFKILIIYCFMFFIKYNLYPLNLCILINYFKLDFWQYLFLLIDLSFSYLITLFLIFLKENLLNLNLFLFVLK
jgi:hypothetical protein